MNRVTLVGRIDNAEFQRNIIAAEWAKAAGHISLEVTELFEFEWTQWLKANKSKYTLWADNINYMVAINGKFWISENEQLSDKWLIDDADSDYQQFYSFCEEKYKYEESDEPDFQKIAAEARLTRMKKSKVWFWRFFVEYPKLSWSPEFRRIPKIQFFS